MDALYYAGSVMALQGKYELASLVGRPVHSHIRLSLLLFSASHGSLTLVYIDTLPGIHALTCNTKIRCVALHTQYIGM